MIFDDDNGGGGDGRPNISSKIFNEFIKMILVSSMFKATPKIEEKSKPQNRQQKHRENKKNTTNNEIDTTN